MKIAFATLGCKVNQYETELLREIFTENGWEAVAFGDYADACIINTCSVTAMSDRKSRQIIRRAVKLNPDAVIAVCGCYSEMSADEVKKIEGVDIVTGTKNKTRLYSLICDKLELKKGKIREEITCFEGKTRAVIKIEDGCDNFCSYCIIPYARGRIRSRSEEEILREVKRIAAAGFKEIVLAGIHVCSYGKDTGTSLIELLEKLEAETDIERIRLSSIEPNAFFDGFIERLSKLRKICPHFHISLQSGCDETLKRMNRRYNSGQYAKICEELIKAFPHAAITTDVIVGFPGETEEEFEKTVEFVKKMPFYKIHTFRYSARKGTVAAAMPNQVSAEASEKRSKIILDISDEKTLRFKKEAVGRKAELLIEREVGGWFEGHAKNYLPLKIKADKDIVNSVVEIEIKEENLVFEDGEQ